jgi:hypothetical protein
MTAPAWQRNERRLRPAGRVGGGPECGGHARLVPRWMAQPAARRRSPGPSSRNPARPAGLRARQVRSRVGADAAPGLNRWEVSSVTRTRSAELE